MSESAAGCRTLPAATWPSMPAADRADKDERNYVIAGHEFYGSSRLIVSHERRAKQSLYV